MSVQIDPKTGSPILSNKLKDESAPITVPTDTEMNKTVESIPSVSRENDSVAQALDDLASELIPVPSFIASGTVVTSNEVIELTAKETFEKKLRRIEYILYRGMDTQQVRHAIRDIRTVLEE